MPPSELRYETQLVNTYMLGVSRVRLWSVFELRLGAIFRVSEIKFRIIPSRPISILRPIFTAPYLAWKGVSASPVDDYSFGSAQVFSLLLLFAGPWLLATWWWGLTFRGVLNIGLLIGELTLPPP